MTFPPVLSTMAFGSVRMIDTGPAGAIRRLNLNPTNTANATAKIATAMRARFCQRMGLCNKTGARGIACLPLQTRYGRKNPYVVSGFQPDLPGPPEGGHYVRLTSVGIH